MKNNFIHFSTVSKFNKYFVVVNNLYYILKNAALLDIICIFKSKGKEYSPLVINS